MQGEGGVGAAPGEIQDPLLNHLRSSCQDLFGGLEHQHDVTREAVSTF